MKLKINLINDFEYENEDAHYCKYSGRGELIYKENRYSISIKTDILKEEVQNKEEDSYDWYNYEYEATIIDVNEIIVDRDINIEYDGINFCIDSEDLERIIKEENLINYEEFIK